MKKILALLLALTLVFALVSCGGSDEDIRGTIGGNDTTTSAEATVDFSMGSAENNTYENSFIGIGCKLDENWTFLTDEEIRAQNNMTQELVGEELAEAIENSSVIYDMSATRNDSTQLVNVNLENLGLIYGSVMDESAYADAGISSLKSAYEQMGITGLNIEKTTISFCGEEHTVIVTEGEANGIQFYQKQVCIKADKYMAIVTASSYVEDTTDEVLSAFYAL